ncbi:MAG: hypothetical protein AM326_07605 [Candidatus Thorarchaeota archaeon SMTZ-45]|nr:MAG: hypothetical protein AM326_07605 [Candidatus Thorarchaeota archaeon SMTZ-45]
MVMDDLARLQRFRRVAQNYGKPLPEIDIPADTEIERLRAQLNASVYLEAAPWMLPSWIDLIMKAINKEETLVTELANNSYRNWSLIGGVGSKKFGVSDSRGLVMAIPGCGSIDIWVLGTDGIIFPALMGKDGPQLKLISSEDQLYEWKTDVQSVEFTRLIYHVEQQGMEYLYNEVILKNIALEEATITFYFTLRPMSVLGFEPIETLEFDAKNNLIFANDQPALQVDIDPSAVYLVEANDITIPEVIQTDKTRYDYKLSSKDGFGTAILKFIITLSPAGTRKIVFSSPLEVLSDRESFTKYRPDNHNRNLSIGRWYSFTKKRGEAFFPDEELDQVLSQAAASLAIQSHSVMFSHNKDCFTSSLNWRDRIRVLLALIKSGGIDVANKIANKLSKTYQSSEVAIDTAMFNSALWGLLKLQGYSLQRESLQDIHRFLVYLAENMITLLTAEHPRQKPTEQFSNELSTDELEDSPLEHYSVLNPSMLKNFNESLWNLAALQESVTYFTLTEVGLVAKIKDKVSIVENLAQEQFEQIQNARWPRQKDPKMFEIDRAILDILTSIVQLRIDGFDKKFLRLLCKKVSERRIIRGLWKTRHPEESFSSHLAMRIAQFHVWDKQRDVAEPLLRRALEFLSEDYLLPEYVSPRTFGGGGGTGSSVLAAADIILLLSDMLVHEDNNNLVFLAGIPSEWYTAKKPLTIKGLPTRFGKTAIEIGQSANQHQIETGMEILPDEIEVHVPETVPLRMVKAYGGSIIDRAVKDRSPHLRLIPLSNDVVLTYHR